VAVREQPGQGPIQSFLSETARKYKIWLVGGSIPMAASTPNKVRNTCLVFDEHGKQVARYDKIHLFNLDLGNENYHEANTIEPGNQVVVVDSPFGRIGLAICYDLRFPELFRSMKNVDIIVLPSAFTETTGRMHWEVLVRARAIENLAYVIASAQGGYHVSGRETHGNHDDRRSLGAGAGSLAARFRRGDCRCQSVVPGQPAFQPARADASHFIQLCSIKKESG